MATDNTKSSLDTAFKYIQENKLKYLNSNSAIVQKLAPMKDADIVGRKFLLPVALTFELGITYGDGTVYALNDSIAAVYEEIDVDPTPVSLRTRVSLSAANRWKAGSSKSVINNVAIRAGQMKKSLEKFAEISILHGRTGVGIVGGVSDSSGTNTVTLTDATWASGIWAGMIGCKLDAYDTDNTTQQNSNATYVLASADFDNKAITITGNTTDTADLAATDIMYFRGANGAEMFGLKYQLDTSGTVFGISSSTYDLWKANEHAVGGALTMAQILKGQAKAVGKGGLDEDVCILVSPVTFESLNDDLAALRSEDSSYKSEKGEQGHQALTYHGQAGKIEVISHPYMMEGDSFSFPKSCLRRVGASDIDFMKDDEGGYFRSLDITGFAGYQCSGYFEFQVVLTEPAKCVLYTGIVNP